MAIRTALHLELTDRCNFKCVFCSASDCEKNSTADYNKCIEIMDKVKDVSIHGVWINTIQLNGDGEPLLHKQLANVICEAKKRFDTVEFITNAYLMTGEKIEEILNTNVDNICISLTGIKPEIYAHFQGSGIPYEQSKKQLDRVLENVKNLVKRRNELNKKTKIILRYIRSEQSRSHLKEYIKYWREYGIDEVYVTPLFNFKRDKRKSKTFKILRCSFVPRIYHICANGEVFPCNTNFNKNRLFLGNVYETPVEDIITSDQFLNEKSIRMSCNLDIVPKSCLTCENRCYRQFLEELKNMRRRIFLKQPLKSFVYRLFGPGIVIFERITRVNVFYNLFLMYLRFDSARTRNKFLSRRIQN